MSSSSCWFGVTSVRARILSCEIWASNTSFAVSKLVIGANMALPAACFCLAMRLEGIAAVRHAKSSHSDKRRRLLVDVAICFIIPCIYMALRESFVSTP